MVVFFLTGVWHGAAWTFVLWGLYNGMFLVGERLAGLAAMPASRAQALRRATTFLLVTFGWVLFRSPSVHEALSVWAAMIPHPGVDLHLSTAVQGPGTDLKLNVAERFFKPADGKYNMPDGEFFTGPVEDSAEGEITFHLPATYAGREVAGVHFRFQGGKVVDATAERGEDFLIEMLDTDEGARRLGELGIGTNFGIADGTGEILLDEKIGGTVHLAVGETYPETGGVNSSAIHWDMICDLRKGGSITMDGELLQQDGQFVI